MWEVGGTQSIFLRCGEGSCPPIFFVERKISNLEEFRGFSLFGFPFRRFCISVFGRLLFFCKKNLNTTSNGGSLGSRVDEDRSKARQGVVNCRIQ